MRVKRTETASSHIAFVLELYEADDSNILKMPGQILPFIMIIQLIWEPCLTWYFNFLILWKKAIEKTEDLHSSGITHMSLVKQT